MRLLTILILGLSIQLAAYLFLDKKDRGYGKLLVLLIILILYGFVLPPYFLPPPPEPGGFQCGMPIVAIYTVFWVLGVGTALITHLIYFLFKQVNKYAEKPH